MGFMDFFLCGCFPAGAGVTFYFAFFFLAVEFFFFFSVWNGIAMDANQQPISNDFSKGMGNGNS